MAKKIVSTKAAAAASDNDVLTTLTLAIPMSVRTAINIEARAFVKSEQEIALQVLRDWALPRLHAYDLYVRLNREEVSHG